MTAFRKKHPMRLAPARGASYSTRMDRWIFKILRSREFEAATANRDYRGSDADIRDGFIHFSSLAQLQGTLDKHFRDTDLVHILAFDAEILDGQALRWEPSRGDALFPHLYGPLDLDVSIRNWQISRAPGTSFNLGPIQSWGLSNV